MKKSDLLDILADIPDDAELVIRTQKRHTLYGDIDRDIEPYVPYRHRNRDGDEENEYAPKEDSGIFIIDFRNEGYSPEQALGLKESVDGPVDKFLG